MTLTGANRVNARRRAEASAAQAAEAVRRWRMLAYGVPIALPFLMFAGIALVLVSRHASSEAWNAALPYFVAYPLFVLVNWPFYVLAARTTGRLRRAGNRLQETTWSGRGGLAGMTIPYAFGYAAAPWDVLSNSPGAGQGFGVWLGFAAPLLAVVLVALGSALGRALWRSRRRLR